MESGVLLARSESGLTCTEMSSSAGAPAEAEAEAAALPLAALPLPLPLAAGCGSASCRCAACRSAWWRRARTCLTSRSTVACDRSSAVAKRQKAACGRASRAAPTLPLAAVGTRPQEESQAEA